MIRVRILDNLTVSSGRSKIVTAIAVSAYCLCMSGILVIGILDHHTWAIVVGTLGVLSTGFRIVGAMMMK